MLTKCWRDADDIPAWPDTC